MVELCLVDDDEAVVRFSRSQQTTDNGLQTGEIVDFEQHTPPKPVLAYSLEPLSNDDKYSHNN